MNSPAEVIEREEVDSPAQSSWDSEPESPWVIEEDATGQKWRVSPTGQRLKVGNTVNVEAGRPTKKELKDRLLGLMGSHAIKRDEAILKGWCLCPACKEKWEVMPSEREAEGAANRLYAHGLGKDDTITLAQPEQQTEALARALLGEVDSDTAMRIAAKFADHLGLK